MLHTLYLFIFKTSRFANCLLAAPSDKQLLGIGQQSYSATPTVCHCVQKHVRTAQLAHPPLCSVKLYLCLSFLAVNIISGPAGPEFLSWILNPTGASPLSFCPPPAAGRNEPLKKDRPKWKSDYPMTEGQLRSKRDEFWDTAPAFEGRKEIWDALKAAAAALECNDHELAQAIVDGASITLPHGEGGRQGGPKLTSTTVVHFLSSLRSSVVIFGDYKEDESLFHCPFPSRARQ